MRRGDWDRGWDWDWEVGTAVALVLVVVVRIMGWIQFGAGERRWRVQWNQMLCLRWTGRARLVLIPGIQRAATVREC